MRKYQSKRWFSMLKPRFCLLVLSAALFAGCNMLVIRRADKMNIDTSVPSVLLIGNVVETGTLGYEEVKIGFFDSVFSLFSPKEERIPAKGEILAKGSYTAQGKPSGIYRVAYPQKNRNLQQHILIDTYHQYYKWTGNIMFDEQTHKANFLIDADGTKSGDKVGGQK
jgi:hypothetical protein